MTQGEWSLCKTGEVSVESEESGVFRSSNRTKGGKNTEGKGRRSLKLANAEECKRDAKVSRTCQLLQTIY